MSTDQHGNVNVAGTRWGANSVSFDPFQTLSGGSGAQNPVLVQYRPDGKLTWSRTVVSSNPTEFRDCATDAEGNLFVVGYTKGVGDLDFGNGVTVHSFSTGENLLVAKYDSQGLALWAKSQTSGTSASSNNLGNRFNAVTVDSEGNLYCVGWVQEYATVELGDDVSVAGGSSRPLLAKYSPAGQTLWATILNDNFSGGLLDVASLPDGPVVAGTISPTGNIPLSLGSGVVLDIPHAQGQNYGILAHYDAAGTPVWAEGVVPSLTVGTTFTSVAADPEGGVVATGFVPSPPGGTVDFGGGVVDRSGGERGGFVARYDAAGAAQWARLEGSGTQFNAVAVDATGFIFVAGEQATDREVSYGPGVSLVPADQQVRSYPFALTLTSTSVARSLLTLEPGYSRFSSLAAAGGHLFMTGGAESYGGTVHDFGNGASFTNVTEDDAFLVDCLWNN